MEPLLKNFSVPTSLLSPDRLLNTYDINGISENMWNEIKEEHNAYAILFDSVVLPRQIRFVDAMYILKQIPENANRILLIDMLNNEEHINAVKKLLIEYDVSVLTVIGTNQTTYNEKFTVMMPNLFTKISCGYQYHGEWNEDANIAVMDSCIAEKVKHLVESIIELYGESNNETYFTYYRFDTDILTKDIISAIISGFSCGRIILPDYNQKFLEIEDDPLHIFMIQPKENEPDCNTKSNENTLYRGFDDERNVVLNALYDLVEIYDHLQFYSEDYSNHFWNSNDCQKLLTKEIALEASKYASKFAQENNIDLLMDALADGIPIDDLFA